MNHIILTKHARERIAQRRMTVLGVEETVLEPDKKIKLKDGQVKFVKQQGTRLYQVVTTYKEKEHAWLVLSAWVRGEDDPEDLLWVILTAPVKLLWKLMKFLGKVLFGWD